MFDEEARESFIDHLTGLQHIYDLTGFTVPVMRGGEDYPLSKPFISVSFIPTTEKIGASLDYFYKINDNVNYKTYSYGEVDKGFIRAFSPHLSGTKQGKIDGRRLTFTWLKEIERYLKINWNTLIISGNIDRGSFSPYREIYYTNSSKIYGYEMNFDIITSNTWTNEPDTGALSVYNVSGIEFTLSGTDSSIGMWFTL